MKEIILDAQLNSDLDWQIPDLQESLLWHLDFGFSAPKIHLDDQASFYAHSLAVEHFAKRVKQGAGVILYKGGLEVLDRILNPGATPIDKANMLGDYLHRLASFLPDEMKPFCLFEPSLSPGKFAQLTSKERFWHLHLSLEEKDHPVGILLPQDEYCTNEVIGALDALIEKEYRVIPEMRLNELWHGLDELIVIDKAVSPMGRRQLQGFIAAGGKVRSRGI